MRNLFLRHRRRRSSLPSKPDEAQDTPYPTLTPRPTPIPFSGITATPYPIRKPAGDPSGKIYFVSDNESAVSFIPIDAAGDEILRRPILAG